MLVYQPLFNSIGKLLKIIGSYISSIQKCVDVFKTGALTYAFMSYYNLIYFFFFILEDTEKVAIFVELRIF